MNPLDNNRTLKRFNESRVADSLSNLPRQLLAAWQQAKKLSLPKNCRQFDNLIFCGMGGSNLASELARAVFGSQIKKPVAIVRNYHLPAYAGSRTLVIITSYSGNTEEALSCLAEAVKNKCRIICIASGGKLAAKARQKKLPLFAINKSLNPSNQPRYDLGSQLGAVLGILNKLQIIKIGNDEIAKIVKYLDLFGQRLGLNILSDANPAKQLALSLLNSNIYIIAAGHLAANAHILANQFNESAKNLAVGYKIPELNHHLLEGFSFPKAVKADTKALFLFSPLYDQPIVKRFVVTEKVLGKQKIGTYVFKSRAKDKLLSALETVAFGGWTSYYLAVLNRQDPAQVPWVDYFKEELSK